MRRYIFYRLNKLFSGEKNRLIAAVFFVAILLSCEARSIEIPETLQIHGFLSQTYILSSDNNFFGRSSEEGSFEFTELGINASIRPQPNLQLSVQIISRRAGKGDDGNVRLDYALADYTIFANKVNRTGVRVGRIKNPIGFYNETRDVAFTRPSILLPQSIYFDRTRNLGLSGDGFLLYEDFHGMTGNLSLEIAAGHPAVNDLSTEQAFLERDQAGSLNGKASYVGRILYGLDSDRLRLSLSSSQLNMSYDAGRNDLLKAGQIRFEPVIFSGQYNAELWSLTFEYSLRFSDFKNFGPVLPDGYFVGESYYFQGTYCIFKNWEMLLRYDIFFLDRDDRDGHEYATKTGKPNYSRFSKDLTAGMRWTAIPSFMIGIEYHHIDGTGWLPAQDNPDILKTKQRWGMFLLMAAYRF